MRLRKRSNHGHAVCQDVLEVVTKRPHLPRFHIVNRGGSQRLVRLVHQLHDRFFEIRTRDRSSTLALRTRSSIGRSSTTGMIRFLKSPLNRLSSTPLRSRGRVSPCSSARAAAMSLQGWMRPRNLYTRSLLDRVFRRALGREGYPRPLISPSQAVIEAQVIEVLRALFERKRFQARSVHRELGMVVGDRSIAVRAL